MNIRLKNQLNMIGACITVAQSTEYKPTWDGKAPADFTAEMTQLQSSYTALNQKAAQVEIATGGAADAKAAAESELEDAAFILARALAFHFKKTGDLNRRGKVDMAKSEIVKLRAQDLVNLATAIRDLAIATANETGASARGITIERVGALTAIIAAFTAVMNTPRSQIVNRGTLLKELDTDAAMLMDSLRGMDDLVLQFGNSEPGQRFIEAWKRARIILDLGGSNIPTTPPTQPTPPAPSKP
jgi:uncharacterized protein YukE